MNRVYTNTGLLVLRVCGFLLAFGHGIGKMPPSDGMISGVGELGFPMPAFFAWMAGFSEFLGGILIGLGLFTRPAAFFVMCTMATAAFMQHADDPFGTKEKALVYGLVACCLLLAGGGKYSLGKLLFKKGNSLH